MFRTLLAACILVLPALVVAQSEVEFHRSPAYAERGLPLSEAVWVGDLLFLSGQLGFVPGGGLAEGGIEAETRQTMNNIGAQLERHGLAFGDVVKCLVMLADIADWPAFNGVYASFFDESFPARSVFGGAQLVAGARVEVECIAARSGED